MALADGWPGRLTPYSTSVPITRRTLTLSTYATGLLDERGKWAAQQRARGPQQLGLGDREDAVVGDRRHQRLDQHLLVAWVQAVEGLPAGVECSPRIGRRRQRDAPAGEQSGDRRVE